MMDVFFAGGYMVKAVGTLTEEGWVTDPNRILDYLLSYYILTDAMQSLTFKDSLISLPFTYFENITDPERMRVQVQKDLLTLIGSYFDQVDVVTATKPLDNSSYGIAFYVSAYDDKGASYNLAKVVQISTSLARRVITLSNEGDALDVLNGL